MNDHPFLVDHMAETYAHMADAIAETEAIVKMVGEKIAEAVCDLRGDESAAKDAVRAEMPVEFEIWETEIRQLALETAEALRVETAESSFDDF